MGPLLQFQFNFSKSITLFSINIYRPETSVQFLDAKTEKKNGFKEGGRDDREKGIAGCQSTFGDLNA